MMRLHFQRSGASELPLHRLNFYSIWVCKKRNEKESMICLTPKTGQNLFIYVWKHELFFKEKGPFKEKWEWKIEQKGFLTTVAMVIKKDPAKFIRKHELKVIVKIVRTASPLLNHIHYTIWYALKAKQMQLLIKILVLWRLLLRRTE